MSVLIFIGVLALLIFVHEFGHFLAAKLTGMKVEEFSVGFKPAIFQKKVGETNYVLGLIPIGGYVKILGENPDEEEEKKLSEEDKKRTFSAKPKWAQLLVLSAGVIFNILLAWIFIALSFSLGSEVAGKTDLPEKYLKKEGVKILVAKKDFPAEKNGIKGGEFIYKIQDTKSGDFVVNQGVEKFQEFLKNHPKNIQITYKKDWKSNKVFRTKVFDLKKEGEKYLAGIYMAEVYEVKIPFYKALYYSIPATWEKLKNITNGLLEFFGQVFQAKANLDEVSGPVGIVKYIGTAAQNGIVALLLFTAMLSLNLAVINFLPFPALDGGRALFVIIEAISRKKIPQNIFLWVNGLGFLFLIGLMVVITFNDILKLL